MVPQAGKWILVPPGGHLVASKGPIGRGGGGHLHQGLGWSGSCTCHIHRVAQACTSVTSATRTMAMWRDRRSGSGWAGTKAAGANRAVPVWKRAGHLELSGGGSHFGVAPAMEGLGHQPRLAMERPPGPRTVRAPGDTVLTRQGVQASLSLAHPPSCPGRPDARGPQLTAFVFTYAVWDSVGVGF